MSRPLRGQVDPDGPPESPSAGARPLPPFIREGLGWFLAIQLLLAFLWLGPPRAELVPFVQGVVSLCMASESSEQTLWSSPPPLLAESLRLRVRQARVWMKAAATLRHHTVLFVRAELESWWNEALAARPPVETRCAC